MGRSPCCDKVGLKKGPWTPEEDQKLLAYIQAHGHGSWGALPSKAGLNRCGKSCRLRWTNYLRPDIKRGNFTLEEELTIIQLHALLGNRWSAIASHLPERTDNEIKNYWNTHLKKRLAKMGIDPVTHKAKTNVILPSEWQTKNAATLSHMAQWESARLEAEARLARQSKVRSTSFQHSLSSPESAKGSSPLKKPVTAPVPPPYLHMLKAWNNTAWTEPTNIGASVGTGDGALCFTRLDSGIESPTSTLNYSEKATQVQSSRNRESPMVFIGNSSGSCEGEMLKEETEEDWKSLVYATNFLEYKDEIENSISFGPGFHDMTTTIESAWTTETLKTGDDDASSGNFAERFTDLLLNNSGNRNFIEGGVVSDNGGSDSSEDRNNYWNTILNFMNSSPPDSPVF